MPGRIHKVRIGRFLLCNTLYNGVFLFIQCFNYRNANLSRLKQQTARNGYGIDFLQNPDYKIIGDKMSTIGKRRTLTNRWF